MLATTILAIGIGATTAMFSLTNTLLLKPLPYRDPVLGRASPFATMSPDRATWSFSAIVSSAGTWAARADILTQKILLNGEPYRVIGVMPAGFLFPRRAELSDIMQLPDRAQYWVPLVFSPEDLSSPMGQMDYVAVARLRRGVTVAQAAADLSALERVIEKRFPQKIAFDPVLHPLQQLMSRRARLPLIVLTAAVATVLLIICINIMNLMMVRAIARRREWAIQLAIGARTLDIVLGALCESALLAFPALAIGCFLADWLLVTVRMNAPPALPMGSALHLDLTAALFALGISAASAILFGLWPAWRASRVDPQNGLQSSGRSATEGRRGRSGGKMLVAVEVALSTVLLLSACLLLRSFAALLDVNPGVNVRNLLTARIALPSNEYKTDSNIHSFCARLALTIDRLPGVQAAGVVSTLPVTPEDNNNPVTAGDHPAPAISEWPMVHIHIASSGYFKAAGIPLEDGRVFDPHDRGATGVMISENLAHQLWPGQSAVGRPLEFYSKRKLTVIGVVGAVRASSLAESPGMSVYLPDWVQSNADMSLVVRTKGQEDLASAIRMTERHIFPATPAPERQEARCSSVPHQSAPA